MSKREMRQVRSKSCTFETREEDSAKMICGYFVVFNSEYEIWPGATESVDRHAFDQTDFSDVRALINHDTTLVLGRTKAGTLKLSVDDNGLYGEVLVNERDQDAMNAWERINRGDVDQCSFGFYITDEEYENRNGEDHWTIKGVDLFEVSVCTFPAYEDTSVSARKNDLNEVKKRELDLWKMNTLTKLKKGAAE